MILMYYCVSCKMATNPALYTNKQGKIVLKLCPKCGGVLRANFKPFREPKQKENTEYLEERGDDDL